MIGTRYVRVSMLLAAMALLGVMAGSSGAAPGDTTRVSVSSSGDQGNGSSSGFYVSDDGRYVPFDSIATNLVAEDTNDVRDAFVRDRGTGTTERVSLSSSGDQANGSSGARRVSDDGRYVSIVSSATNLVEEDTNGVDDVFVRDRDTGTTERVSVSSSEGQANGSSGAFFMSTDGRYVGFTSDATNLVEEDTNGVQDVFVRDRDAGTTERVSVSSSGDQWYDEFSRLSMSEDGRYIAFNSVSPLVAEDTNGMRDVFVYDRDTEATERVSVNSSGDQANNFGPNDPHRGSQHPAISADGRYVAFLSVATDLVAGDINNGDDAFVHDRDTDENGIFDEVGKISTERVSVDSCGNERENTFSFGLLGVSISLDGRYVGFNTYGQNLVPRDTNRTADIFVNDRDTGKTERVNVSSSGTQADRFSSGHHISADGRYVGFTSDATNLVAGDTNGVQDVFVHERRASESTSACPPTTTASATTSASGAPYEQGTWTNEDVKVTLSAQAKKVGTSIEEIRYSATGAQSISETVYNPQNPLLINTEGTTTISYFAIDNAGNRSPTNTFTVKIDKVLPTVINTSPSDKATGVRRSANIVATFSEAMDPDTITGSKVTLAKVGFRGSTTPVAATVTVSPDGKTVTLDPSTNLGAAVTYRATIKGGSSGVTSQELGSPLAADKVWSFKTGLR